MVEVTADGKPGVDADMVAKRLDAIIADYIAKGPTADEMQRVATQTVSGRIAGLEQVGGFGGKAVALAEGELYMTDPDFSKKRLDILATANPPAVPPAMQQWFRRLAYSFRSVPGEAGPY